jgi:phosphotransferase system HPr-like phosphotransfer protein
MIANLLLTNDLNKFCHVAAKCPVDVKLTSADGETANGKNPDEIYALNLSKPVSVEIDTTDTTIIEAFKNELQNIVVNRT